MRRGKLISELDRNAITFEEWQSVNDLSVPKRAHFHRWANDNIEGEPLGTLDFAMVQFSAKPPQPDQFKKPGNAFTVPADSFEKLILHGSPVER